MPRLLWLAVIAAIILMWVSLLAGCGDGCPQGQHSQPMTVNGVVTILCIDD